MRVAVTDACIFIDLIELDMISAFFRLDIELHTTVAVIDELFHEQKQVLEAYQSVGKLQVHNLVDGDFQEMKKIPFPRGLSQEDRSVIYLAQKLGGAIVISSDRLVRDFAGKLNLPYHGIFWILDESVNSRVLSPLKATEILSNMPRINSLYRGGLMKIEIEFRIENWGKLT
jgi:predicted nucleic acid-binding protein